LDLNGFSRSTDRAWYNTADNMTLSEMAMQQQVAKVIQENTTPRAIGQGAGGALTGSITEIPYLTWESKCN
jgi:hypothetical protein